MLVVLFPPCGNVHCKRFVELHMPKYISQYELIIQENFSLCKMKFITWLYPGNENPPHPSARLRRLRTGRATIGRFALLINVAVGIVDHHAGIILSLDAYTHPGIL